jgi:hypothetical protein
MSDDRQQADALNRFWDDLADTDGPPAAGDLNADHRETLRQIHAMTRTPPPATARTRVDRAMREWLAVSQNGKGVSTMSQTNTLVPGPLASDPPEWVPWRPAGVLPPGTTSRAMPWAGVNFAFALLLLITLGLGYLSFHPGALPSQRLAALPALVAPATPESAE